MENIRQGSIIKGPNWPEPVEIKLIEEKGSYVRIVGATTISRTHIDQIIPAAEFSKFVIVEKGTNFSEEPWKVFLGLETIRYRFASMYDRVLPASLLGSIKMDELTSVSVSLNQRRKTDVTEGETHAKRSSAAI